jgi:hypothetical protein
MKNVFLHPRCSINTLIPCKAPAQQSARADDEVMFASLTKAPSGSDPILFMLICREGWSAGRIRSASSRSSICGAESLVMPLARASAVLKASASCRRHSKQGRWPALSAVASSRKNSSVYFPGCISLRLRFLNSVRQMIQVLVFRVRTIFDQHRAARRHDCP